jgi:hypothetical protein
VSVCVSIQDEISLEYVLYNVPESGVIEDLIGGWIRERRMEPRFIRDHLTVDEEAERLVTIRDGGIGVIVSSVVVVMVRA